MRVFIQAVAFVVTMLFGNSFIHAQISNDPSGHWEGTITMPMGTIGIPDQKLKGLPLTSVAIDGSAVTFAIRGGQGGTFRATLSADGRSMTGKASNQEGEVPFVLARTGEARIMTAPKSAPIGKELEGTWSGTLDVRGGMRVILKMANQPDGTSTGTMVSVDEGNLELAVAIAQQGSTIKLSTQVTGSEYSGTLSADRKEIVGTFTTLQGLALPLTLRRVE
jgi:hypothetical protein